MRWPVIRLIWFREFRDLLRDRRTLFLVLAVPVLLYPGIGVVGLVIAYAMAERPFYVGVAGTAPDFPVPDPSTGANGHSPAPVASWLALTPGSADRLFGSLALVQASRRTWDLPSLVVAERLNANLVGGQAEVERSPVRFVFVGAEGPEALAARQIDLLLVVPADFWRQLEQGGRPQVELLGRNDDERSRLGRRRLYPLIEKWKARLKEVRLLRRGLPARFDEPLYVTDPEQAKPLLERATNELFQMLVRVLPFLMVMWSLAGALYPAVDAGAGEKERGTLETLLVSPATRAEIVWGKFLAVWLASTATTLWNLLGLTACFLLVRSVLPLDVLRPAGLAGCAVMVLPLSALFAAICLPVGVYARSTKEGQYYLMPLLLGTVLLVFWAMAPDMELNWGTGLIPVTGAVLLQQRVMTAVTLDQIPWVQVPPVAASLALCIWLALRWSMHRFRQEGVLFREGQRGRAGRWFRRLVRTR